MRVWLEKDGVVAALDGQPLARGGEAAIYPIPDRAGLLAKVYHQPTPEQADKLTARIANPPADAYLHRAQGGRPLRGVHAGRPGRPGR